MRHRKRKIVNRKNKIDSDVLIRLVGLLFGFLSYIVNVRPKLGQYEQGFLNCSLVIVALAILWFSDFVTNKLRKR